MLPEFVLKAHGNVSSHCYIQTRTKLISYVFFDNIVVYLVISIYVVKIIAN